MDYVNMCCSEEPVFHFLRTSKDSWLRYMRGHYKTLSPVFPHAAHQMAAWRSRHDILYEALAPMGDAFGFLFLIFEYCLPVFVPQEDEPIYRRSVVTADCVILSREHVIVLEFQDSDIIAPEPALRPTYRVRRLRSHIKRYHNQSRWMDVHGILVSSARAGFLCHPSPGIAYCSADKLREELVRILSPKPALTNYQRLISWVESTYSDPEDDYYAQDKGDSFSL